MSAQMADTLPATDVAVRLEICHCRSVHAVIFGKPAMVGDAHVPAAAPPDVVAADVVAVDAFVDDAVDEPPEAVAAEGAVGSSRLDLFANWQPVSSTDAARVTVSTQEFLVILVITLL
jgi:hypothetical protein